MRSKCWVCRGGSQTLEARTEEAEQGLDASLSDCTPWLICCTIFPVLWWDGSGHDQRWGCCLHPQCWPWQSSCRLSILLRILYLLSKSSQYPFEIDTTIALFSEVRQLRPRRIKQHVQGHTASGRRQSYPGLFGFKVHVFLGQHPDIQTSVEIPVIHLSFHKERTIVPCISSLTRIPRARMMAHFIGQCDWAAEFLDI